MLVPSYCPILVIVSYNCFASQHQGPTTQLVLLCNILLCTVPWPGTQSVPSSCAVWLCYYAAPLPNYPLMWLTKNDLDQTRQQWSYKTEDQIDQNLDIEKWYQFCTVLSLVNKWILKRKICFNQHKHPSTQYLCLNQKVELNIWNLYFWFYKSKIINIQAK